MIFFEFLAAAATVMTFFGAGYAMGKKKGREEMLPLLEEKEKECLSLKNKKGFAPLPKQKNLRAC